MHGKNFAYSKLICSQIIYILTHLKHLVIETPLHTNVTCNRSIYWKQRDLPHIKCQFPEKPRSISTGADQLAHRELVDSVLVLNTLEKG